jgi:transaldolase
MKLFIDTANAEQIREAWGWGIIDGGTTNPSHVAKTGRRPLELYREIFRLVDGPVSLETVTLTAPEIVKEGRALARIHKSVVVTHQ